MGNSESAAKLRGFVLHLTEAAVDRDNPAWSQFWENISTPLEVFSLLKHEDIREIIKKQRGNIVMMIDLLIQTAQTNLDTTALAGMDQQRMNNRKRVLNCIRCLYRLIPVIYEDQDSIDDILFSIPIPSAKKINGNLDSEQLPIIVKLFHLVKTMLFFPGFSISAESSSITENGAMLLNDDKPFPVWFPGVEMDCRIDMVNSDELAENRIELLRLLIALFSETVYIPPEEFDFRPNKFAEMFCCGKLYIEEKDPNEPNPHPDNVKTRSFAVKLQFRKELFLSLLNGWAQYLPEADSVSSYFASSTSGNPWTPHLSKSCLQLLLALVDYPSPENEFKTILKNMTETIEPAESSFLYVAMADQLAYSAKYTYAQKAPRMRLHQEVLVLTWFLLTASGNEGGNFTKQIMAEENILAVFEPMATLMWYGCNRATEVGLVHLCVFLLLVLSGIREFSMKLNDPLQRGLSLPGAPFGSYGYKDFRYCDVLVMVCHKLIVDGGESMRKLYSCLITIICNVSPYTSKFNLLSSHKIMEMFAIFSKRKPYHDTLPLFLDLFNNVIQYQYATNESMIYTLCSSNKAVQAVLDDNFDADEQTKAVIKERTHTLSKLLNYLVPKIEALCNKTPSEVDHKQVLEFLKNTTVVGVLPVPHPIIIRKYEPNRYTNIWFTTYLWGVFFLQNNELPLWEAEAVKLFAINVVNT